LSSTIKCFGENVFVVYISLAKKTIQIDTTYNEEKASSALYNALFSKFTQNPSFKKVLLATNDSLLINAPPRKKQYDAEELMKVRDEIKIQTNYKK
jgi:hypothetical protein